MIDLADGFAEGVRNGTFKFSEESGRQLLNFMRGALYPEYDIADPDSGMKIYTIGRACRCLGISQPTFRKYVREGIIPKGIKIADITERVWNKDEIEAVKKRYFSSGRKSAKD